MIKAIEDSALRLDAIEAAFTLAMPTRHIKRTLKHFTDQDNIELLAGILTIVTAGEADFANQRGMVAREGTLKLFIVGHIRVAESDDSTTIEVAELAFTKELKAAINTGVTGISFTLERIEQSKQLEHPYGWFVAFLNAGPPRAATH